ncbi:MAG: hypothetical protein COA69_12560 [Robiginitomaculum sp.]|nr:MAG: hypothetical protein COA69_12560 [Robiginitomaculum sp.]
MCTALAFTALNTPNFTPLAFAQIALFPHEETVADAGYEAALKAYQDGDPANALIHGKLSGGGGNVDAQVLVGYLLMREGTGFMDKDEAAIWFLKAAKLGQVDAMVALSELALNAHGGLSPTDAVKWLEMASANDRTDAMRALADIYIRGRGITRNRAEGRGWLVKAANYGDPLAERKLGDLDIGVDPKKALIWYERAADHGDAEAAYSAAIMYAENFEIPPSASKAAKLLSQAAEAGIAAAQADYGLIVYQGNGVPRSAEKAAQWFKRAAYGGDPEGRFLYAFTLAKGDGVEKSFEDAYYWLLLAEQDSGETGIDDYDRSRTELQQRLEDNVDPAVLMKARKRATSDTLMGTP